MPACVWSSLRSVGVTIPSPPRRFTSSKATAYSALSMAGGVGRAELVGRAQDERPHLAPARAQRERDQADRVLPPLARLVARDEVDADPRLGVLRTVVRPQGQDRRRRAAPEPDSVLEIASIAHADLAQVLRELVVEARRSATGTSRPAYRAPPARWRRPSRCRRAPRAGPCSFGSRRRSRSPRRRSRCGRSPSRGSRAPDRAARRRRAARRARRACGRARSRRSRSDSNAGGGSWRRRRVAWPALSGDLARLRNAGPALRPHRPGIRPPRPARPTRARPESASRRSLPNFVPWHVYPACENPRRPAWRSRSSHAVSSGHANEASRWLARHAQLRAEAAERPHEARARAEARLSRGSGAA